MMMEITRPPTSLYYTKKQIIYETIYAEIMMALLNIIFYCSAFFIIYDHNYDIVRFVGFFCLLLDLLLNKKPSRSINHRKDPIPATCKNAGIIRKINSFGN